MKKVMAITDSLGMPRPGIKYTDTWIFKLSQSLPQIHLIDRSKRGTTTNRLSSKDALEFYDPDCVIVQLGIVDCAPRYSNKYERKMFDIVPDYISKPYMNVMKLLRERHPKRSYVDVSNFHSNIQTYSHKCNENGTAVFLIRIAPPTEIFKNSSKYICESIQQYNMVIQNLSEKFDNVSLVDPYERTDDINKIMIDHEHPNVEGHNIIAEAIAESLCDDILS